MGQQQINCELDPQQLRCYTQRVLRDLRALEQMIADGLIETGLRRIGMEQELVLVDRARRPAPVAVELLQHLNDRHFKSELGRFNIEANLDPIEIGGDCLRRMERTLRHHVELARAAASRFGVDVIFTGILPTTRQADLDIDNLSPEPRYQALNAAIKYLRGREFELRLSGIDEIDVKHDSVMLEACNTSCQIHLQVAPEEFARYYNVAQALAGPVLAACCNSPFLLGRRLWRETRIAVFEQSIDTRVPTHHVQDRSPRVSFGKSWVRDSILEIFEEDVARFRVVAGSAEDDEDPFQTLARGEIPCLKALMLHNSTVYRWNRPCYGILDGRPHLRIENRVLPSGPTMQDEMANSALWFGTVMGLAAEHTDITRLIDFDTVRSNFGAAVRQGLDAHLFWLDGRKHRARELVGELLVPLARRGLAGSGIDAGDTDHYLGIIEERMRRGQTGAEWMLRSYAQMQGRGTHFERLRALVAAMSAREREGLAVHEWSLASIDEAGGWKHNFQRVGQYMTTDLFTVHEDEVIDLIANVMAWRNIRHVPVEDDDRQLVGMVSYRVLMSFIARDLARRDHHPVPVSQIMQRDHPTVSPETSTREAIELMLRKKVACLPVVRHDRLVGIVTEHDFMNIAAHLLDESDRENEA